MDEAPRFNLIAQDLAAEAIELIAPLMPCLRKNKALAEQIERAATSVLLNVAEASGQRGGNRRIRLESARGSANEMRGALQAARAWRLVSAEEVAPIEALYERVLQTTYKPWRNA